MRVNRVAERFRSLSRLLVPALFLLLASAARASGGGEEEGLGNLFWYTLNFVLLVAVLVYFARKPVQDFFSDRRTEIKGQIESASATLSEVESRHASLQRRLVDLDSELERIRGVARERALSERERILAGARAAAERIKSNASAAVSREVERARDQLRLEAAELAIELAAARMASQVDDADRDRLIDEFINRIESGESVVPGPRGAG